MVAVTESRFPALYECLDMIADDAGFGGELDYELDDKWDGQLARIDAALSVLSDGQREMIAMGSESEQQSVASRSGFLRSAVYLFEDFTDGGII